MFRKFYIYLITNKISNKQYIGSRTKYNGDPYKDNYMGSSTVLNLDYKKFGIENFLKEIIIINNYKNKEHLLNIESEYIKKYNTLSPNGYNRQLPNQYPGFYMTGYHHTEEFKENLRHPLSEETKKKISIANKGKKRSEETKIKLRKSHMGFKGKKHSEKSKQKMSKSQGGKIRSEEFKENLRHPLSEETKKKIKNSLIGIKHTEERNKKMRGRKFSEEHKKKISIAHKGKNLSEETKKKISIANKEKNVSKETKIKIKEAQTENKNYMYREKDQK